jgi:uncharacterized protein YbdZ (MbtH family)
MNMYEARYKNAKRIMNTVNTLIDKGYTVMDGDAMIVDKIVEEDDVIFYIIKNDRTRYNLFLNDMDADEGLYTPIKAFNQYFDNWTYFRPEQVKKLKV